MSKKQFIRLLSPLLLFAVAGFCIITNTSGVYRAYWASDLPFSYRLHSSTPANYVPVVWAGASEWNNVEAAYFEFVEGPFTSNGSLGQNGENLVYFDFVGDNFDPNTNVIAFSSTWTSNAGGYHAVESDYIYNARDFPPGLNGEPGRQDLHSISVHEFGHHLGLDHTGLPGGASSGCGPLVQSAVMWAFGSSGDTSRRHLHIEDIVGVAAIYPNWILEGNIIDAGSMLPLSGMKVQLNGTYGADIGPVVNPIGNRRNRIGLLQDYMFTDVNGFYNSVVVDKDFNISADGFGYYPSGNININFNTPSGYGNTQTIVQDIQLQPTPLAALSLTLTDTVNNQPIEYSYEIFWVEDLTSSIVSSNSDPSGSFSETLNSAEYYRIEISIEHPYIPQIVLDNVYLPEAGLNLDIGTKPASILYVQDSENETYVEINHKALKRSNYEFAVWDNIANQINLNALEEFSKPLTLYWYTTGTEESGLSTDDIAFLKNHLMEGGGLILTGQNIAELTSEDSLLANYIGVGFDVNNGQFPLKGFDGDIIGDGISFNALGGWKDRLTISENSFSNVFKSFHFGTGAADTTKIAAVRFENNQFNYKGYFMGFGFESVTDTVKRDQVLGRILNYVTGEDPVTSVPGNDVLPQQYFLAQNYPNPFNPSTTIVFNIPIKERVELKIFNSLGQEITTLVNTELQAGNHKVEFNAASLASGVYFYRLKTDNFVQTKKLLLLK